MSKRVIAGVAFVIVLLPHEGLPQSAPAESSRPGFSEGFQAGFAKSFRPAFETSFVKSCVSTAGANTKTTEAIAERVCSCTAKGVLDRIAGNEWNASRDEAMLKPIIQAEGARCVEDLKKELSKAPAGN